jgi:hypothetical protein
MVQPPPLPLPTHIHIYIYIVCCCLLCLLLSPCVVLCVVLPCPALPCLVLCCGVVCCGVLCCAVLFLRFLLTVMPADYPTTHSLLMVCCYMAKEFDFCCYPLAFYTIQDPPHSRKYALAMAHGIFFLLPCAIVVALQPQMTYPIGSAMANPFGLSCTSLQMGPSSL